MGDTYTGECKKPEKKDFKGSSATFCYREGYNQAIDEFNAYHEQEKEIWSKGIEASLNEKEATKILTFRISELNAKLEKKDKEIKRLEVWVDNKTWQIDKALKPKIKELETMVGVQANRIIEAVDEAKKALEGWREAITQLSNINEKLSVEEIENMIGTESIKFNGQEKESFFGARRVKGVDKRYWKWLAIAIRVRIDEILKEDK